MQLAQKRVNIKNQAYRYIIISKLVCVPLPRYNYLFVNYQKQSIFNVVIYNAIIVPGCFH